MQTDVMDNRLLGWYQKRLAERHDESYKILAGQRLCGSQVIQQPGVVPAVFVVANKETSRYFGVTHCHSPWACPRCSAVVMAQKGMDIACALDALEKYKNQQAFMMTLTLPHTAGMTCKDTWTILQKTWRRFSARSTAYRAKQRYILKNNKGERGAKGGALGVGKAGSEKIYCKGYNPFGDFKTTLEITYHIRIYEFTWGINAWHPHIHALFWCPKKNWDKIIDFESKLLDEWWRCARIETFKYFVSRRPNNDRKELEEFIDYLFRDGNKYPKTGHRSLFISKTSDGKVRKQESSHYVTGWSSDKELTSRFKNTKLPGHYTPLGLLDTAYKLWDEFPEQSKEFLNLYIEYSLATKGNRRVQWAARTDIHKIIAQWKQTEKFREVLKKKFTAEAKGGKFHVVCWLSKQDWYTICYLDNTNAGNVNIRATILELALLEDGRRKIAEFLRQYDIQPGNDDSELGKAVLPTIQVIENKIFENTIAA